MVVFKDAEYFWVMILDLSLKSGVDFSERFGIALTVLDWFLNVIQNEIWSESIRYEGDQLDLNQFIQTKNFQFLRCHQIWIYLV